MAGRPSASGASSRSGSRLAYGAAAWWAVFKGRKDFDEPLRPLQTKLAIGLCGLALFLALPILDFGAISATSQLARLERGKVNGRAIRLARHGVRLRPEGRERLDGIAEDRAGRRSASWPSQALKAENRYDVEVVEQRQDVEQRAGPLSAQSRRADLQLAARPSHQCRQRQLLPGSDNASLGPGSTPTQDGAGPAAIDGMRSDRNRSNTTLLAWAAG